MRFGSSNYVFKKILNDDQISENYESCTYKGISLKVIYFLLMTVLGAGLGIFLALTYPSMFVILAVSSGMVTLISSIVALLSIRLSKVFGTIYCLFEGLTLGVLSYIVTQLVSGAVGVALLSTIAVFGVCAFLFVSNVVKVNSKFLRFLTMFVISYIFFALVLMVMQMFGYEMNLGLNLLVSAISIFIASLYLFFDLENIRQVVQGQYPKQYEWYAAFGLSFTLIWLYVEILRIAIVILSKANDR
ncbi:MAG: Bax inhibitor-1/YccA family protein [Bacilli bacterium]|nr:Bax inhibitor-1/YccA family protein [Bacilli bacterium]